MLSGCATYRAGVGLPDTDTPVAALAAAGPGRLTWIGLVDPSPEECQRLAGILHLDRGLADLLTDPRPRTLLHKLGDARVLVAGVARYDKGRDLVEIGTLTLLLRAGLVVSVARHVPAEVEDVRRTMEATDGALSSGPSHVAWLLMDAVVTGYAGVLQDLRADVEVLEREAFSTLGGDRLSQRIYLLKREALDFRHAASALLDPLSELAGGEHRFVDDATTPDWAAVADRLDRLVDRATAISDLLTGVLTAYQTDVALRQNEDMRKISAWVAIAVVPTLVAGIYGMNFDHMPELSWRFGYPAALGLMATICLTLYTIFRRQGWL